jgi:ribosomal protein L7Ae-like RNA K-turn-binding protein
MNKILNLLGLATRGRYVVLGEELVLKAMSTTPGGIVFLATDSGANITKKIMDKSETYRYTVVNTFDSDELSKAIGKTNRKLILVSDKGFVKKFKEYLST